MNSGVGTIVLGGLVVGFVLGAIALHIMAIVGLIAEIAEYPGYHPVLLICGALVMMVGTIIYGSFLGLQRLARVLRRFIPARRP